MAKLGAPLVGLFLVVTDSFYPAPQSSYVIATATNPRQIGLIDRDLGHTEMGL